MGFRKADNPKEILIAVEHAWHRGAEFVFPLAKRLSQEALDAQEKFFGLKEDEAADVRRKERLRVLGLMLTREPEGFDDFPRLDDGMVNPSLVERFVSYFDDDTQPELERIALAAWNRYWQEAVPVAYLKSPEDSRSRDGELSGVSREAAPAV